jgi:hypothetical protein
MTSSPLKRDPATSALPVRRAMLTGWPGHAAHRRQRQRYRCGRPDSALGYRPKMAIARPAVALACARVARRKHVVAHHFVRPKVLALGLVHCGVGRAAPEFVGRPPRKHGRLGNEPQADAGKGKHDERPAVSMCEPSGISLATYGVKSMASNSLATRGRPSRRRPRESSRPSGTNRSPTSRAPHFVFVHANMPAVFTTPGLAFARQAVPEARQPVRQGRGGRCGRCSGRRCGSGHGGVSH